MRVTKRIAGDHSFFIHTTLYKYPNDITSQYSQRMVLQRYYLLTPISTWHYNYNRTPLSTRVITMPKARQQKRSGSASSGKSEKRVKRVNKIPTGENKAGLTPAIPFCEAVKDINDVDDKYVFIKVKIDQDKGDTRVNLEDKKVGIQGSLNLGPRSIHTPRPHRK